MPTRIKYKVNARVGKGYYLQYLFAYCLALFAHDNHVQSTF